MEACTPGSDGHVDNFTVMFKVRDAKGEQLGRRQNCAAVLLATGSLPAGRRLAQQLGHSLTKPVPSLFSLRLEPSILDGLAGMTLTDVRITLAPAGEVNGCSQPSGKREGAGSVAATVAARAASQRGPLLVTHRGVSGPAVLRLSAYAARELKDMGYTGTLLLNLLPDLKTTEVAAELARARQQHPRKQVHSHCPFPSAAVPKRLWAAIVTAAGLHEAVRWGQLSKVDAGRLIAFLVTSMLPFTGKDTNKEEFVTAGGVVLAEVVREISGVCHI